MPRTGHVALHDGGGDAGNRHVDEANGLFECVESTGARRHDVGVDFRAVRGLSREIDDLHVLETVGAAHSERQVHRAFAFAVVIGADRAEQPSLGEVFEENSLPTKRVYVRHRTRIGYPAEISVLVEDWRAGNDLVEVAFITVASFFDLDARLSVGVHAALPSSR